MVHHQCLTSKSLPVADAKDFHPFSVRGFFSCPLWVKSYILYLLLGNVVVKLYFYLEILLHRRLWSKYGVMRRLQTKAKNQ